MNTQKSIALSLLISCSSFHHIHGMQTLKEISKDVASVAKNVGAAAKEAITDEDVRTACCMFGGAGAAIGFCTGTIVSQTERDTSFLVAAPTGMALGGLAGVALAGGIGYYGYLLLPATFTKKAPYSYRLMAAALPPAACIATVAGWKLLCTAADTADHWLDQKKYRYCSCNKCIQKRWDEEQPERERRDRERQREQEEREQRERERLTQAREREQQQAQRTQQQQQSRTRVTQPAQAARLEQTWAQETVTVPLSEIRGLTNQWLQLKRENQELLQQNQQIDQLHIQLLALQAVVARLRTENAALLEQQNPPPPYEPGAHGALAHGALPQS